MRQVQTRKVSIIKSVDADYRKSRTVGAMRPKPIDADDYAEKHRQASRLDFRKLAKWYAASLPLDGEEWGAAVSETEAAFLKLTKRTIERLSVEMSYVFSRKVPEQESRDVFNSLYLLLRERGIYDVGLAYAVARDWWRDYWRAYKVRQHYSLDAPVSAEPEAATYGDLLVGVCDFEAQMIGKVDGDSLLSQLPEHIQRIVRRKLDGYPVSKRDSCQLRMWVNTRPTVLAQYVGKRS